MKFARLLVLVPLLVVGCKKKEPAPAPVAAAEPPSVEWKLGPASQAGLEGVGTLTIPIRVTVHGDKYVLVRSIDVGVDTDSGRVCVLHSDEMKKIDAGTTTDIVVKGDCPNAKLPEGEEAKLQGVLHYAFKDGEETRYEVDQKVTLKR